MNGIGLLIALGLSAGAAVWGYLIGLEVAEHRSEHHGSVSIDECRRRTGL